MPWLSFKSNWRNNQQVKPADLNLQNSQLNTLMFLSLGPVPILNQHYFCNSTGGAGTSNTLSYGLLRVNPWDVYHPIRIDRFFFEVVTVGDASNQLRLGLFADNGKNQPGSLILDIGNQSLNAATTFTLTANLSLQPGRYWIGSALQGTGTQATLRVGNTGTIESRQPLGTSLPAANTAGAGFSQSGVTGVMPSTFTGTGTAGSGPRIGYRVAEVL